MKRTLAAAAGALAITGGTAFMATPAQAQPVFTGGLVNVNVTDVSVLNDVDVLRNSRILNNVLNNNNVSVGVAANIAAQVCADANVAAVIAEIRDTGGFSCDLANEAGDLVISQAQ
jgi:hypothetical protein